MGSFNIIKNRFTISICFFCLNLSAQDTITYKGILDKKILIETIELYQDSTFKWTNEYDLRWSEYGNYKIENNKIILNYFIFLSYPMSMSLKDSIKTIKRPNQIRTFEVDKNRIYPLRKNGKRVLKFKDSFFKRKWGWLIGNRFDYKIEKIE